VHELMKSSLTEAEKLLISNELEKLFVLQDRPFSAKKSTAYIEEFEKSNLPMGAIIAGIRSLIHVENLPSLDFPKIAAAARSKIEHSEYETVKCETCDGRGMLMMRNESFYEFAFKCHCANSSKVNHLVLAQWNGESVQLRNGNRFSLAHI